MPNQTCRYLLLSIICLLPAFCFAQKAYDGQVIDKATEDPVQGVNVLLLKEKTGTQTNEQGYFELSAEQALPNDTLQFSSVGYKTFKLPLSEYEFQIIITLEASNVQLNEVHIANKKKLKDIVLGQFSSYDLKDYDGANGHSHHVELITDGTSIAKLFLAPRNNMALKKITIGRKNFPSAPDGAIRNKYTKFLIHIILQDTITGKPGKILFTKEISLSDYLKMVDLDLSDEKIIIPVKNFFIAVEWIINPYNEIIGIHNSPKVAKITKKGRQIEQDAADYYVYYQPFLVGYHNETTQKPALIYIKYIINYLNKDWFAYHGHVIKINANDIALSATMHY